MEGEEQVAVAAAYIPLVEAHAVVEAPRSVVEASSSRFQEIPLTPQDIRRLSMTYGYVFKDANDRLTIFKTKGGNLKYNCCCGNIAMGLNKMQHHLYNSHNIVLKLENASELSLEYKEFVDPAKEKKASPTKAVVDSSRVYVAAPPRAEGEIFVDEERLPIPRPDADEAEVRAFNSQLCRDGRLMPNYPRDGGFTFGIAPYGPTTIDEVRQTRFNGVEFSPELEAYLRRTFPELNGGPAEDIEMINLAIQLAAADIDADALAADAVALAAAADINDGASDSDLNEDDADGRQEEDEEDPASSFNEEDTFVSALEAADLAAPPRRNIVRF